MRPRNAFCNTPFVLSACLSAHLCFQNAALLGFVGTGAIALVSAASARIHWKNPQVFIKQVLGQLKGVYPDEIAYVGICLMCLLACTILLCEAASFVFIVSPPPVAAI